MKPAPAGTLYHVLPNGETRYMGEVTGVTFDGFNNRVDVFSGKQLPDVAECTGELVGRFSMRLEDNVHLARLYFGARASRYLRKSQLRTYSQGRRELNRRMRVAQQVFGRQSAQQAKAHANPLHRFARRCGMPLRSMRNKASPV